MNNYQSYIGIKYIKDNIENIQTTNGSIDYQNRKRNILTLIKGWFCIYREVNIDYIKKQYEKILLSAKIKSTDRGYAPALELFNLSEQIFNIFYLIPSKENLSEENQYKLIYFTDKYGAASCSDCNAFEILNFLRLVFVKYAENNFSSTNIQNLCNTIIQSLEFRKTNYIAEFNALFKLTNSKNEFRKIAEYWCGNNGLAWTSDYINSEYCAKSIIDTLNFFGDYDLARNIEETLKLKIFGYTGHKDYSLYTLLKCYNEISLTEKKVCEYSIRMLIISDLSRNIGDNRISNQINKSILNEATKLGFKYLNALFEIKNTPKDLVYWRMLVLEALFNNIELIPNDEELNSLYKLTNAWIKPYIEKDRYDSKLESLKRYNSIIIAKISDPILKQELQTEQTIISETNNLEQNEIELRNIETTIPKQENDEYKDIITSIQKDGFTKEIESTINQIIQEKAYHSHNLIFSITEFISSSQLEDYVNSCIIKYILSTSNYGFTTMNIQTIFDQYYNQISEESWKILFQNIIERYSDSNIDLISSFSDDIALLAIYYSKKNNPSNLENLFNILCDTHERFISANRRINLPSIKFEIDDKIKSLTDMVNFQLHLNR